MAKDKEVSKEKEKKPKKKGFGKVVRFFKDLKGEFKKVVWPNKKQVVNNTFVVCVVMIFVAAFVFGIDTLLGFLVNLMLK